MSTNPDTSTTPTRQLELGLDTFGDRTVDADGAPSPYGQVIRDVVEQAVLADRVGVDFIGLGEHHRDDFAISSPDMVLAAIAPQTERIKLGTAVTVLSSDDPVRVVERFNTLDAVSRGRAEIILGRGSFTESFPLFGFDLADYERLFEEKLEIFALARHGEPVTWSGSHRSPLQEQQIFPLNEKSDGITAWIGVGGSPESVVRSVQSEIPMMLAIIGGDPARFLPYVDLYHRAQQQLGVGPMPLGTHSPGYVAETDEQAADELWPNFKAQRDRIGRDRGWPPVTREEYEAEIVQGSLYVGSPETVAAKIARTAMLLGLDRFDLKYSNGPMSQPQLLKAIELYGTEVIPRVREIIAENAAATTGASAAE
ncbi:LLM class flavin-dependent oxidoreductase [Epidermidibacterium keratini]|uniref:LLM class flavin-dependent oxidoreductase n=1 Tax=Epidermidibacterium keratini TaxID=1891644 RepID=A0A7L4YL45_9ACTN|nr:LLM class flavin-dependent oxidoreductase [Epidermidibacterium keratini]QHB99849.1 LLM class flavin-dependent oxidoreductase [Epidermidibacterium keratini]